MEIIWTDFAIKNLKDIFDFYSTTANKKVANKIKREILASVKLLVRYPELGQFELFLETLNEGYRYILSGNYKVIYKIQDKNIVISDLFDVRQNPIKMNDKSRTE